MVYNSNQVVEYLRNHEESSPIFFAFSIDLKELFYSMPQCEILNALRDCIESGSPISFHNSTGMSIESFLKLVLFYLSSTVVKHDGAEYVQKEGTCIASCIAPALSDIFLAYCDQRIAERVNNYKVRRIFRYVDDYLVVMNLARTDKRDDAVGTVLDVLQR